MCSQRSVNKSGVLVLLLTISRTNWCVERSEYSVEPELLQSVRGQDAVSEKIIRPFVHYRPKPHHRPPQPFQHAGVPRQLAAYPVLREGLNNELQLNVSWLPSIGPRAKDYSLEISSITSTEQCNTTMCYEYNIPADTTWYLMSSVHNPVPECAVHPGCAYHVRLIAHPWDGHTTADVTVQLDECVSGVCSCTYAPLLPVPSVSATTISVDEELAANVTWNLPAPEHPQQLPLGLNKAYYVVSIGKQMVSDAHPSPWFANTVSRRIDSNGSVFTGDSPRWSLMPIDKRSGKRGENTRNLLDVRLLARVYLVDSRGCGGLNGNATAYDPAMVNKKHFGVYAAWAAFGGLCVLAMLVILAVSTRMIKRALNAFRSAPLPAPLPAPLEPQSHRLAWFPMQLRT